MQCTWSRQNTAACAHIKLKPLRYAFYGRGKSSSFPWRYHYVSLHVDNNSFVLINRWCIYCALPRNSHGKLPGTFMLNLSQQKMYLTLFIKISLSPIFVSVTCRNKWVPVISVPPRWYLCGCCQQLHLSVHEWIHWWWLSIRCCSQCRVYFVHDAIATLWIAVNL